MEYREIIELIEIFEKTDLNDMEVMLGNDRLRLNRSPIPAFPQPSVPPFPPGTPAEVAVERTTEPKGAALKEEKAEEEKEVQEKGGQIITAPIVGTFYQSSAPDAPPFVKVGDQIKSGDVVCIIEAMKFMNEVNSEISGTVTEILVQDGDFVEYGQELFRVE